jgi:hypothetical protein
MGGSKHFLCWVSCTDLDPDDDDDGTMLPLQPQPFRVSSYCSDLLARTSPLVLHGICGRKVQKLSCAQTRPRRRVSLGLTGPAKRLCQGYGRLGPIVGFAGRCDAMISGWLQTGGSVAGTAAGG